ncbi:MAG: pseudouridine-5'-phosphate glycosidase [Chloroflexota bacterium]
MNTFTDNYFTINPQVQETLDQGRPVVALESTVITHGLPYPDNLTTAKAMEDAVREGGALPATIGIISGEIHVGLSDAQLAYLAGRANEGVRKCSRRDLPLVLAGGLDGGTTVAATMLLAHRAGISIFATGGIGGVHRGHPFDVSADLTELSRTPVAIVCSGAKSVLDLPATLEVLETNGVPVIGLGTDEMPAFFSRGSGLAAPSRLDTAAEVAEAILAHRALGLRNGLVVAVPVPEQDEFDPEQAEAAIEQVTKEADALGLKGPETTPWLLSRLAELTDGDSLRANVALLANNGRVAAEIAVALAGRSNES